ncbi:hypothetical protein [Prosthecobacter sp.]|jgi:hypothetical protein|nr:hypothetical protein [Prosthecobacter sp.]
MPESSTAAYPYLEEALPGFHRGRVWVKARVLFQLLNIHLQHRILHES